MRQLRLGFILVVLASIFITTEQAEASNGSTYDVGVSVLHVREEPTNQSSIIGVLHQGDQLTAFGEKHGWVQTYYAGEPAWVAKHYLIPKGEVNSSTSNHAQANTKSITVAASSVHIRSGPGTEYQAIEGTSQGESFKQVGSSGDWIKVSLANGQTGWIASWLTSASNENVQKTDVEPVASVETKQEKTTNYGTLSGTTIVLDAGHGGRDPGAIGLGGVYEKDIVLSTTTTVAEVLRTYGANVVETRTSDYYQSLDERTDLSNAHGADAFISLHYNSFPVVSVQGINTFYYDESSSLLASSVHAHLATHVALHDRGVRQADFKVLRNTSAPGILLELGFITNAYDLSVVQTADYQYQAAEAIAQGLIHYFN